MNLGEINPTSIEVSYLFSILVIGRPKFAYRRRNIPLLKIREQAAEGMSKLLIVVPQERRVFMALATLS